MTPDPPPLPDPARPDDPAPWPRIDTRRGPDLIIARARFDRLRNPRTERTLERVVLEVPDWVNVVAITPSDELVAVRQRRFGNGALTVEIPGGMIDPGEAPLAAAQRELREETGYAAPEWTLLATIEPNPAIHDNLCYHYLARGAYLAGPTEPDEGEDIRVELIPRADVLARVASGEIRHSLVVAALARVLDLRSQPWNAADGT